MDSVSSQVTDNINIIEIAKSSTSEHGSNAKFLETPPHCVPDRGRLVISDTRLPSSVIVSSTPYTETLGSSRHNNPRTSARGSVSMYTQSAERLRQTYHPWHEEGDHCTDSRVPLYHVHSSSTPCYSAQTNSSSHSNVRRNLFSSLNETALICRICHEGEHTEEFISPCNCAGTMGLMHKSCIEKWLSSSNTNKCEICDFEYVTKRIPRPFRQWLKNPSQSTDRRNLLGDILCFCLLTPLASVSAWLCTMGASHYAEWNDKWETLGLLILSVFLVIIYLVWCSVAIRYHYKIWREWQSNNQNVHVVGYSSSHQALIVDYMNNNCESQLQATTSCCSNSYPHRPSSRLLTNPAADSHTVSLYNNSKVSIRDLDLGTMTFVNEARSRLPIIQPTIETDSWLISRLNETWV